MTLLVNSILYVVDHKSGEYSTYLIQPNIDGHDCLTHLEHAGVSNDFASFISRNFMRSLLCSFLYSCTKYE